MEIVRSGVGVNYREPPDEIGRVGISAMQFFESSLVKATLSLCCQLTNLLITSYTSMVYQ